MICKSGSSPNVINSSALYKPVHAASRVDTARRELDMSSGHTAVAPPPLRGHEPGTADGTTPSPMVDARGLLLVGGYVCWLVAGF